MLFEAASFGACEFGEVTVAVATVSKLIARAVGKAGGASGFSLSLKQQERVSQESAGSVSVLQQPLCEASAFCATSAWHGQTAATGLACSVQVATKTSKNAHKCLMLGKGCAVGAFESTQYSGPRFQT